MRVVGDDFLSIPLGDVSSESDEFKVKDEYSQFGDVVYRINQEIGRTTMNSLKKNFFVDFNRAGLIDRFNKNRERLDPSVRARSHIYFVRPH